VFEHCLNKPTAVMPGLVPGHPRADLLKLKTWMAGTSPAMTNRNERLMFDNLSERLGGILDRLTRRGALTEADVSAAAHLGMVSALARQRGSSPSRRR
jgi:hypothetical protein